ASGTFADRNVAAGKQVSVSGLVLGGTVAGNYIHRSTRPSRTASISAPQLTVSAQPNTKVYDGNTSATAVPSITGLVGGDTASFRSEERRVGKESRSRLTANG